MRKQRHRGSIRIERKEISRPRRHAEAPTNLSGKSGGPVLRRAAPLLFGTDDSVPPVVLVSLLQQAPAERADAVARIGAMLTSAVERPLFLTDDPDFSLFTESGSYYEYLVPITEQLQRGPGLLWDIYLVQRVRIILDKWRPSRIICCGLPVEDFIRKAATAHQPLMAATDYAISFVQAMSPGTEWVAQYSWGGGGEVWSDSSESINPCASSA